MYSRKNYSSSDVFKTEFLKYYSLKKYSFKNHYTDNSNLFLIGLVIRRKIAQIILNMSNFMSNMSIFLNIFKLF